MKSDKTDENFNRDYLTKIYKDSDMTSMTGLNFNQKPNEFASLGEWKRMDENCLFKNNTINRLLKEISESIPTMKYSYETFQEFLSDAIKFRVNITTIYDATAEHFEDYKDKLLVMKSPLKDNDYNIICTNKQQLEMFRKIQADGILGTRLIVI